MSEDTITPDASDRCGSTLRPLAEWIKGEGGPGGLCRPCVLPVVMAWYEQELAERGLGELASEIEAVRQTGDPLVVASRLDSIKERVEEPVREVLRGFDCEAQSFQLPEEDEVSSP